MPVSANLDSVVPLKGTNPISFGDPVMSFTFQRYKSMKKKNFFHSCAINDLISMPIVTLKIKDLRT